MADPDRKRDVADAIQTVGGVSAGGVGAAFGGSKLRDAFAEDYPDRFRAGVRRSAKVLTRAGVPQPKVTQLTRAAVRGKPGFVPLAAATGGAGVVALGRHYEKHVDRAERRARRAAAQAGSAAGQKASDLVKNDPFELAKRTGCDTPGCGLTRHHSGRCAAPVAKAACPNPHCTLTRGHMGRCKHAVEVAKADKPHLKAPKPSPSSPLTPPGWLTSLRHVPPEKRLAHVAAIVTGQRHQHAAHGLTESGTHAARKLFAAHTARSAAHLPHGRAALAAAALAGGAGGGALAARRARRNDARPSRYDYPTRYDFPPPRPSGVGPRR
jgi:hypothetical protein